MKQTTKIWSAIAISSAFFLVEIVLGFRQRSLALVADAFHVASDIIGFIVALVARYLQDTKTVPGKCQCGESPNLVTILSTFR